MQLEQHHTVPDAAVLLKINEDNLLKAIHDGEIVAVNVAKNPNGQRPRWRISETEMGKFLLRRRNPASLQPASYQPIRRRRRAAN